MPDVRATDDSTRPNADTVRRSVTVPRSAMPVTTATDPRGPLGCHE